MSLESAIKIILDDFEKATSDDVLGVVDQIKPHFKSQLIVEYLDGKLQKIKDSADESEKKKQCKALVPYFDWYLQGL